MPALKVCSSSGCHELVPTGRCAACTKDADRARGTAAQRGYGSGHRNRFRKGVLRKDPTCVICQLRPSTTADHWPDSRRDLERKGLDPNDPQYGRGLCAPCHSTHTAVTQAGGWNLR